MKIIVGIDEAGRGPLAGPVAVGCVLIRNVRAVRRVFPKTRDSKQLSEKRREGWFVEIKRLQKDGALSYAVKLVGASIIDTKGIVHAISLGISHTLSAVGTSSSARVLLDGGLKAPARFKKQTTIIKGDEKELSIALASVVAKVTRDRYMTRLAKKYPAFGFEVHKGYGTKRHTAAIRRWGMTPLHRKTFCRELTKHG